MTVQRRSEGPPERFGDIVIDSDWDGLMSGAILLRANPGAQIHPTDRRGLASVLASLDSKGPPISVADLAVNDATWPVVEQELSRLSVARSIVWFDSHRFSLMGRDPRETLVRFVFEARNATARLVQREYEDPTTERLARAAEMADQTRDSNTDWELWQQVYVARPAVSAWRRRRNWLRDIVTRLAANPKTDFRKLPGLEARGIRALDEMWEAVARIREHPSRTYEGGLVAVWIDPRVPATVRGRLGALAGGLAMNRTAVVAVPSGETRDWLDVRARAPGFWREVDLRILDEAVTAAGGHGSGAPGATHWDLPRHGLDSFLQEVGRLAPCLHGKPQGEIGGLPPRRITITKAK